jgi:hypothetical protein
MNEVQDLLKTVVFFLLAIIVGFVAWFGKRNSDRIDSLEKCTVSRDELERFMAQARQDRMAQHQENRDLLMRIEQKIDSNEERSSKTRHDTNETIHELAMKLAVMDRRRDER